MINLNWKYAVVESNLPYCKFDSWREIVESRKEFTKHWAALDINRPHFMLRNYQKHEEINPIFLTFFLRFNCMWINSLILSSGTDCYISFYDFAVLNPCKNLSPWIYVKQKQTEHRIRRLKKVAEDTRLWEEDKQRWRHVYRMHILVK